MQRAFFLSFQFLAASQMNNTLGTSHADPPNSNNKNG